MFLVILSLTFTGGLAESPTGNQHWLSQMGDRRFIENQDGAEKLQIFCHPGREASIYLFWTATAFRLKMKDEDGDNSLNFEVFLGNNVSEVDAAHKEYQSRWLANPTSKLWRSTDIWVDPFRVQCVGVLSRESRYAVALQIYRVNYWLAIATLVGLLLFNLSPKLCRNVVFHYASGVTLGMVFSVLIVTYFVQKRLRMGWRSWFLGVYSLAAFFMTNLGSFLYENRLYLVMYLVVVGGVSFAFCYRLGPVSDPRSLDLIQWFLQLVGLLLIYISSHYQTASLTVVMSLLLWSMVPTKTKSDARTWYKKRFFRPKIRLLSEAEYMDQSRLETEKALTSLRENCKAGGDLTPWKMVLKLKNPKRFAEFVEGSSHLTQEEVIAYSYHETDDEDLDVDIDVDNMNNTRHNGSDEEEMLVDAQHMTEDEGSDRE